jgi:hypothetical protein
MPSISDIIPYERTTYAFYKGTRPPALPPKAVAAISAIHDVTNDLVADGFPIAQVIARYLYQMDKWSEELVRDEERYGSGGPTTAEEWLSRAWGADWKKKWALWYANVAYLLKNKGLKDDDMNGWYIVCRNGSRIRFEK